MSETIHGEEAAAPYRRGSRLGLRRPRLLLRGESVVTSIGLALVVILAGVVAACGWWVVRTQRISLEAARRQQIEAVSDMLAASAEVLVAERRLTPLQRMVRQVARRHDLQRCRIVRPDGQVIVAANGSHATVTAAMDETDGASAFNPARMSVVHHDILTLHHPLAIPGDGEAQLQVVAVLTADNAPMWQARAGVGVVGVSSLLALLVVYRHFRSRLRGLGVVREALLAMLRGEQAESALTVAGDLGKEASAWNRMLDERRQLRQQASLDKMRDMRGVAGSGQSELSAGCDAVSCGLMLVDEQLRVRYANHAAAIYLQTLRDTLLSTEVTAVINDPAVTKAIREAVAGRLNRRATCELERLENDSIGVIRFHIHPLRRGERTSAMIVLDDVTQQRAADQGRHQFVAQATHELRAPLTNIRLYLEALQDGEADIASHGQALNVLNQETGRLERLVNDLLSMAEIETASFELHRDDVKLDALLNEVHRSYDAQAQDKRLTFDCQLPPKLPIVRGDRDKLMLAMQNLVSNAIKYTSEGGQVTITAEADERHVAIEVRDTGIGIGPEDLAQVFEKFYRAHDKRVSHTTGTGLGLALVREIARLHGGDVTATSQVNEGSIFTFTLPAEADAATATEQEKREAAG